MRSLLQLVDLITSDSITLAATGILSFAVLALLVLIAWPSREEARGADTSRRPRAMAARALAASGIPASEIARRTGLSRDALHLMMGMTSMNARQKAPTTARLSLFGRFRRMAGGSAPARQVAA